MFLRLKVLLSQKKKKQKIKSAHSSGRHSSCHLWPLLLGAWWHLAARPSLLMQLLRDLHHLVYYSEKCITLMYPNCICFLCTQICTTLYTPPCIEVPKLYRGTQICTQIFWWFLFSVLLTKMHFLNFCCQKLYVQSPEQLCLCWELHVCENCHRCCVVWFFMLMWKLYVQSPNVKNCMCCHRCCAVKNCMCNLQNNYAYVKTVCAISKCIIIM